MGPEIEISNKQPCETKTTLSSYGLVHSVQHVSHLPHVAIEITSTENETFRSPVAAAILSG